MPDNPCGKVFYDSIDDSDEGVFTTKVDYTINNNHSIFGRFLGSNYFSPFNYDGVALMSSTRAASTDNAYSAVFGDTFLLSSNTVNTFRATVLRGAHTKESTKLLDYNDLGIKATPVIPEFFRTGVTGAFSLSPGLPTATPTWVYQIADDISILRGDHQIGIGANYIRGALRSGVVHDRRGQQRIQRSIQPAWAWPISCSAERPVLRPARRPGRRCVPTTSGRTSRTTGA